MSYQFNITDIINKVNIIIMLSPGRVSKVRPDRAAWMTKIHTLQKKGSHAQRVRAGAPAYLAQVLKYLVAVNRYVIAEESYLSEKNRKEVEELLLLKTDPMQQMMDIEMKLNKHLKAAMPLPLSMERKATPMSSTFSSPAEMELVELLASVLL